MQQYSLRILCMSCGKKFDEPSINKNCPECNVKYRSGFIDKECRKCHSKKCFKNFPMCKDCYLQNEYENNYLLAEYIRKRR